MGQHESNYGRKRRDAESEFFRGADHSAASDVDFDPPKPSKGWSLLLVLLLVMSGAATYYFRDKMAAATDSSAKAEAQAKESKDALERAQKDNLELATKIDLLEKEIGDLRSSQRQLASEVEDKDKELSKLKSTYDALQDKMKKEIGSGDIRLTQGGGKLQVDFVDKILFDSGDATISKRGEEILSRIGAVLASVHDRQIQVFGHTDNARISEKLQDRYPTNWELSSARAINVVRFLGEKAGVPEKTLAVGAYGPYHPVASNVTPKGRARNRRIEIVLTPLLQPTHKAEIIASKAKPRSK
jgi:chemotaxis protein MotB